MPCAWRRRAVILGLVTVAVSFSAGPPKPPPLFLTCEDGAVFSERLPRSLALMKERELPRASDREIIRINLIQFQTGIAVITLETTSKGWLARGRCVVPTPRPELDERKVTVLTSEREISQDDWIMARFLFSAATDLTRVTPGFGQDSWYRFEWVGPSGRGCIILLANGERADLAFGWMRNLSGLPRRRSQAGA